MENKIVVKNDGQFRTLFGMSIFSMLVFCLLCIWLEQVSWCWGFIALFGTFGFIAFGLAFIPRLELGCEDCSYRNVWGRTRKFMVTDIAKIRRAAGGEHNFISLVLVDGDGKKLAEISNQMENYEKIILYFQTYSCASRIWNGREWIIPQKIQFPEYEECLEVKQNKQTMILSCVGGILFLGGFGVLMGLLGYQERMAAANTKADVVYWICSAAGIIGAACWTANAILSAKRERLLLTREKCFYINPKGIRKDFLFADIKESEIQVVGSGIRSGDMLILKSQSGEEIIRIRHDCGLVHVADIPAFIEYWQQS